jgi:hypothetical protein
LQVYAVEIVFNTKKVSFSRPSSLCRSGAVFYRGWKKKMLVIEEKIDRKEIVGPAEF